MKTLAMFVAILAVPAMAQDKAPKREFKDRVEITGKIVCVGCTLEKESGADAQCTLHSKHAQGLQGSDGLLYTFLDNAKGHVVATNDKLRGKDVKVLGWKYPKSQVLEISKYQVKEGDKWVAYDYCKTCGFEPGDNKDKDLCEDCLEKKK
jgi:hypothetical protein